jgi:hypothetical protein
MHRFQCAALCAVHVPHGKVTVPALMDFSCNMIIIIKTCVICTVVLLFDRVLALIPSIVRPISPHEHHTTSQGQLLLASYESLMLNSRNLLPPSIARKPKTGLQ